MKKSILSLAGATAIGVLALGLATSSSAIADPSSTPRTYVATGSDTTQDVWNGLSNGGAGLTATQSDVASYDAFGTATINLNNSGTIINRPAGSGAGVKALSASADTTWAATAGNGYPGPSGNVNVVGKIQVARSSSGPKTAGTDLRYIPFARDAVSIAIKNTALGAATATTAQLKAAYQWNGTGAQPQISVNGVLTNVTPLLPQADSGTRAFFLKALGLTEATVGAGVTTVGAENNGTQLTAANQIIPFSAAQWISQKNTVTTNTTAGLKIADLNGKTAVAGSGTNLTPGTLFGNATQTPAASGDVFARDTYNVINNVSLDATLAAKLRAINAAVVAPAVNPNKALIEKYGFLTLSYTGTGNELTAKFEH
ncbi:hypothetical protein [Psychromicrobium lacuslunae]|uniref:hypothetical protein n=1 Tax=Psychromicrobium lacuslunae TaxID=1618207 RepID=UPI000696F47B|nr:hypothetical protein [Psychromicrobium lacuslunae]